MSIAFQCKCGKTGKVADSFAGKVVACPQCKGPVELPPTAPPVTNSTPETPKPSGDSGMYEMAHLVGFLIILFAGFAGVRSFSDYPYERRFQSDNAYGAAANALEAIRTHLSVWGWVFLGVSIIVCSKLSRLISLLRR